MAAGSITDEIRGGGSRPVSRVLCTTLARGVTIIPLGAPLPTRSSNLPGSDASHAMLPYLVLLRMGFAVPPGVGPGRGELLPHPFTLAWRLTPSAVCFLLPAMMRRDKPESDTHHHCPLLPVGLSVTSRCPAVSRHPALRSPDFPLRTRYAATVWATSRSYYTVPTNVQGSVLPASSGTSVSPLYG